MPLKKVFFVTTGYLFFSGIKNPSFPISFLQKTTGTNQDCWKMRILSYCISGSNFCVLPSIRLHNNTYLTGLTFLPDAPHHV
jgi:hypothetical protein